MTDRKEIARLVEEELARANEIYPPFNSAHEGYAVIREELEEMMEEIEKASGFIDVMWKRIKVDDGNGVLTTSHDAYNTMFYAIAEAIQVCAMLKKMDTIEDEWSKIL